MALGASAACRNAKLDSVTTTVGSAGKCAIYNGSRPAEQPAQVVLPAPTAPLERVATPASPEAIRKLQDALAPALDTTLQVELAELRRLFDLEEQRKSAAAAKAAQMAQEEEELLVLLLAAVQKKRSAFLI